MIKINQCFFKRSLSSLLILIIVLLCMVGCNSGGSEQPVINLEDYISEINEIADSYGDEVDGDRDFWLKQGEKYIYSYYIYASKNEYIYIVLNVTPDADNNASPVTGSIGVQYYIDKKYQEENFDLELFVKLVNFVSDREITIEYCNEFLEAPQEDSEGLDYFKSYKNKYFDFWNERALIYKVDNDDVASLSFGGVTKPIKLQ